MFVLQVHLSTVIDASKNLLLCTVNQLLRVQKLVGGVTWNASCLDMYIATAQK